MIEKQVKMNRPYSPTTVMSAEFPTNISEIFTVDIFNTYANEGFNYVKNKLNKHSVNAGEIMLEFYNCNSNELEIQTKLVCITVLVLINRKDTLNEINDNIYDKLINYTVGKYVAFLETI